MSKFFSVLKSHPIHVIAVLAMVFATVVLTATSQSHGLLIAIFLSFTIVGFVANEIPYEGKSIFMLLAFILIAILCLVSMGGAFMIKRPVHWQDNMGGLMFVMNLMIMLNSIKMAWRICRLRDREERVKMLRLQQDK